MPEYLDFFPAPFLDDLVQGRCLPFVGAGLSLNAVLPAGKKMLDWDGVGRHVADKLKDYEYTTALEALSAFAHEFTRTRLVELITDALQTSEIEPGKAHEAFCEIPFQRVITTNWDFLLELSYSRLSRFCIPIVSEEQLSVLNSDAWVRLLKLHGDLNHPSRMVITEEDYDGFITSSPLMATYLASLLIERTALFIGYSLDDPDFRQIWHVVKDRLGALRRPAYSIQVDAAQHSISRLDRRGVKVINLPRLGRKYGEVLELAFRELRDYWSEQIPLTSTAADPESQVDLALPSLARTWLAFFAVPTELASLYKRFAYPVAKELGFTPTMAVDVVSPGDNLLAKIQAMLERSSVVIVDLDSRHTSFELGLVLSREGAGRLIVVSPSGSSVPVDLRGTRLIVRPADLENADESELASFESNLQSALAGIDEEIAPRLSGEAERLLGLGEYRAAVLAAFAEFEHVLRGPYSSDGSNRRIPSLRGMVDWLLKTDKISDSEARELHELIALRNAVVHSQREVDGRVAASVIEAVRRVLSRF